MIKNIIKGGSFSGLRRPRGVLITPSVITGHIIDKCGYPFNHYPKMMMFNLGDRGLRMISTVLDPPPPHHYQSPQRTTHLQTYLFICIARPESRATRMLPFRQLLPMSRAPLLSLVIPQFDLSNSTWYPFADTMN